MIVLGKSISSKDEESKDHFKVGVMFDSRVPRDTRATLNAQKLVKLCVSQFINCLLCMKVSPETFKVLMFLLIYCTVILHMLNMHGC